MLDRTKIWNDSYQSEALRSGRAGVHVMTVISASHNKAEAIAELQFRFSTDNGSASADAKLSAAEMRRLAALLTKHADRLEVLEAEAARLTQDANPTK